MNGATTLVDTVIKVCASITSTMSSINIISAATTSGIASGKSATSATSSTAPVPAGMSTATTSVEITNVMNGTPLAKTTLAIGSGSLSHAVMKI